MTTPIATTSSSSRIAAPPISSIAISTSSVVKLVLMERPTLSMMLKFTVSSSGRSGARIVFSRMRSNTTMVSFTEYPATVRMPTMNIEFTSIPRKRPRRENAPSTIRVSCASVTTAAMP